MSTDVTSDATLSDRVAEEIRALMARRRIRQSHLAREIGANDQWLSVRLTGKQPIDLNDLERIAAGLGVKPADLLVGPRTRPTEQSVSSRDERKVRTPRQHTPARTDAVSRPPNRPVGPHRPVLVRGSTNG